MLFTYSSISIEYNLTIFDIINRFNSLFRRLVILIFIFTFGVRSYAADPIKVYSKKYDIRNGLASNNLLGAILDADDMLWMYSSSAVTFFDGTNVINYTHSNTLFNLSSSNIYSIFYKDGFIYVIGNAGIDRINYRTKKSTIFFKDNNGIDIHILHITPKNKIVVADKRGNIYLLENQVLNKIYHIRSHGLYQILDDKDDEILISNTGNQITRINLSNFKKTDFFVQPYIICLPGMFRDSNLGLLIFSYSWTYELSEAEHRLIKAKKFQIGGKRLLTMTPDFVYSIDGYNNLSRIKKHSEEVQSILIDRIENAYVNQIIISRKKDIILITNQGLIVFKEPENIVRQIPNIYQNGKELNETRRSIVELDNQEILQITYNSIAQYNPKSEKNKLKIFNKDLLGYAALRDNEKVWIGSDGNGLLWYDIKKNKLNRTNITYKDTTGIEAHITAIHRLDHNRILLGLYNKGELWVYNTLKDQYSSYKLTNGDTSLNFQKISYILGDSLNNLWICTDLGLIELDKNFIVKHIYGGAKSTLNGVNYVIFRDYKTAWLATDNGVVLYDFSSNQIIKHYNKNNGLAGNKCLTLLQDGYGTFWVPTYAGLSRINIDNNQIQNYYQEDGFSDNEYNYGAFLKSSDGTLYFGGLNGYISVTPTPFKIDEFEIPKVYLTDVVYWERDEPSRIIELTDNTLKFQKNDLIDIRFSVPNYLTNEYIKYTYKIDGIHSDWIDLDRQNVIRLNRMNPGKYVLKIKARLSERQETNSDLLINLVVGQKWYESSIFYILIALLLPMMIFGYFLQGMKAKKNQAAIRTSLTNDIHDEVGTLLTKAAMQAELIRSKDNKFNAELLQIENNVRQAVNSFRNILWVFNASQESVGDLIERINSNLNFVFQNTKFNYVVINHSSKEYFISDNSIKRNIIYIIKELAHNTLKHSNGDFFEVIISNKKKNWNIIVKDNGKNDLGKVNIEGIGLKSIRDRVARIKGHVQFNMSEKGFQTEINF